MIFSMVDEVTERRTPLQLSMDQLAQRLSMISFAIIGVICLMGVLQNKPWLEMFTIGGEPEQKRVTPFLTADAVALGSVARRCGHP